jgi:hypothetical protein
MEVYDANFSKVDQSFSDNQSFAAGQSLTFPSSWTPTNAGTYTVHLGVFTPGWAQLYTWVGNAATITISAGGTPPPPPPPPPPPQGTASISPASQTLSRGQSLDFSGHNFGHEESVLVTQGGNTVTTAHADGGGNFSTGSISVPSSAGTYTFTFTGQSSGFSASSTITVQ